jgi:LacI family transcriptional regulator, galactose operon repressor
MYAAAGLGQRVAMSKGTAGIEQGRRPRLEDVARLAGVSSKTASRVLNNEAYVQEDTRKRVLKAVKDLDYRPHPSARSLAANRSFLVAMLYDNASPNYTMQVQDGVLQACDANHYGMVMQPMDSASPQFIERVEALISDRRLDGLVLTPPIADHLALLKRLDKAKVPYACVSPRARKGAGADMDEVAASCEMVTYLASLGHRRIGHIMGPADHAAGDWRLEGYKQGLKAAGLTFTASLVARGTFLFDSGVAGARKLFRLAHPPTAIFAANDDMAAGVIWAANEAGMDVPGQLSVSGFDDTPLSRQLWPLLTTIHQPCQELGRIACTQLFARIRDGRGALVRAPYSLCIRQSTAPLP